MTKHEELLSKSREETAKGVGLEAFSTLVSYWDNFFTNGTNE